MIGDSMMYRKIAAVLALVLGLSLTACGGSPGTSQSDKTATEENTEAAEDDFWEEETTEETSSEEESSDGAAEAEADAAATAGASLEGMLEETQAKTETEVADAAFSNGQYKGDVYTQPYFGITFTKTADMTFESPEALLKASGISAEWDDVETIQTALADNFLMDLQISTTSGDTIMAEIFEISLSEDSLLDTLSSAMKNTMEKSNAESISTDKEEIQFLGEPRNSVIYHATLQGVDLYMRFCSVSKGPYTIVFYTSTLYDDHTLDYLNMFKPVE